MELETKFIKCHQPGQEAHSVPVSAEGHICCGNCGGTKIVMVGTASTRLHLNGCCESHDYCKDCKHITWPGHSSYYSEGKWYTREATKQQIEQYER